MSAGNALSDVTSQHRGSTVAYMRNEKLLPDASAALSHIVRATAELEQVHETVRTHSEKLAKIAQLKVSIEILEDTISFYEVSEENLKSEFVAATTDGKLLGQLSSCVPCRGG